MALRALVVLASLRPTAQQGKEEDPNILGRIELETTQVEPVNVRALCFEGLGQQLPETSCTMLDPRTCTKIDSKGRETWDEDTCDTLPKGSPIFKFCFSAHSWNVKLWDAPCRRPPQGACTSQEAPTQEEEEEAEQESEDDEEEAEEAE